MGLDVSVGFISGLRDLDPEAIRDVEQHFVVVGGVLKEHGLPQHAEPSACESWSRQMFGYAGLHYLRRIAAHLDAGLPLPPPGDAQSSEDPVLAAYFEDVLSKKQGLMQRLFKKPTRVRSVVRSFDPPQRRRGVLSPAGFPERLVCR